MHLLMCSSTKAVCVGALPGLHNAHCLQAWRPRRCVAGAAIFLTGPGQLPRSGAPNRAPDTTQHQAEYELCQVHCGRRCPPHFRRRRPGGVTNQPPHHGLSDVRLHRVSIGALLRRDH
eukprot:1402682-Prymnesium_polylepis.1